MRERKGVKGHKGHWSPIGAGTAELFLAAFWVTRGRPGHCEGGKERDKLLRGVGIGSMVSRPSRRWVHEPVKRCCICTRHSTYYTTGPTDRACECRNAGQQCTGCYYWGRYNNRGRLMPPPNTARGLLGHLLRGAYLPAVNQRVSPPLVRLFTSYSLWAILAARDGGGGARGCAGGNRIPRDGRGGGRGAGRKYRGGQGMTRGTEGEER